MGGGRRPDGRSHSSAVSWARRWIGSVGVGRWLGSRRSVAGDPVFAAPAGTGVAMDVRDRALPALLVFYLRRYVKEPDISADTRRHQAASGDRPAIWEIFAGPILKTTILASLVATGMQGGYYAITAWVPRFL